jgi:hypothetical protein
MKTRVKTKKHNHLSILYWDLEGEILKEGEEIDDSIGNKMVRVKYYLIKFCGENFEKLRSRDRELSEQLWIPEECFIII